MENPQHPYSDSNNEIEEISKEVQKNMGNEPKITAQDIMNMITGLGPEQQQ